MASGTFGEHMKRERELRGVSLDEISAATRIASRFLRAIEDEQWDQLPGGVFNRGFVRAVARYLGLDEEDILAEYGLVSGEGHRVPVWTGSPPAVTPDRPWLPWALAAVVALAVIAAGWFTVHRIVQWRAGRAGVVRQAADPVPPASSIPEAAAAASTADGSPPPAPNHGGSAPATDSSLFQIKIEAKTQTRLTVDSDAGRLFNGTIHGGEAHVFTARELFQISTDDAGALVLELNGQTLAPIGPHGREGAVTVTRETLRQARETSH